MWNLNKNIKIKEVPASKYQEDLYPGALWWSFKYKFTEFSVYYDPADYFGSVGVPYYEFYDGDTLRSSNTIDIEKFIANACEEHDRLIDSNPELFL